ncbi:MAG: hypothetical protein IPK00_10555 [Deltaproteobacteria bacterium]|nr:hypothetical protein [Deltaproteobacteria bacterium]
MKAARPIQALLPRDVRGDRDRGDGPGSVSFASEGEHPREIDYPVYPPAPPDQTEEAAAAKSAGCQSCHLKTDQATMHPQRSVVLGCTDCHGGDATVAVAEGAALDAKSESKDYAKTKARAHVQPTLPETWEARRNEVRTYALLNRESPEYVRFVNPSDYRVVEESCGACHGTIVQKAKRSIMATGAMLLGGASYNNGIVPYKRYILGEAYTRDGLPAAIRAQFEVTRRQSDMGVMAMALPLPTWETVPPADVFRIFERGGRNINSFFPETGLPNPQEEPGKPDVRASFRGPGTGNRISVPVLNVHKTRLNDPNMVHGDEGPARRLPLVRLRRLPRRLRERSRLAQLGLVLEVRQSRPDGDRRPDDRGAPQREGREGWGHPIKHAFSRAIPTAQCMNCHMHQPNMFVNSYLGYTMWDYESDAPLMWPEEQRYPSIKEIRETLDRNPEEASYKGKWADVEFLADVWKNVNPKAKDTQFADYHGHGWNFRAIFKRSRDGTLLDKDGKPVADDLPAKEKFERAVHMRDIHADIGMQCADCHFGDDAHGNGEAPRRGRGRGPHPLPGLPRHRRRLRLAEGLRAGRAGAGPRPLAPQERRQPQPLRWRGGKLYQRLILPPHAEFAVSQVKDSVTPGNPEYNAKSARAKLMAKARASNSASASRRATAPTATRDRLLLLPQRLGDVLRRLPSHDPGELEDRATTTTARSPATTPPTIRRSPATRCSSSASTARSRTGSSPRSARARPLVLSSTDINRNRIYIQQQPVSAGGYSAQAFAPHFPHTVRKTETKTCSDCHVSEANDNNAIMAQLMLLGTNFVSFMGYNAWVGTEHEVAAVQVTEWDEPQAVIGSYLHQYAYPDYFKQHLDRGRALSNVDPGQQDMDPGWVKGGCEASSAMASRAGSGNRDKINDAEFVHHSGRVGCLQLRGEYLYVAEGEEGMQAFDVSSIGTKGFSKRFVTAPFSPLGQNVRIKSKDATCVALPTTQLLRPERNRTELAREVNLEQPMHPIYSYAAITDAEEGLILVDVETLADFEPRNNFLRARHHLESRRPPRRRELRDLRRPSALRLGEERDRRRRPR